MDVEILARAQFAFTIAFHYIYPPLSIGLGLMMVINEGFFLKTKRKEYETLTKFWTRIFAITFAVGVATGIVMEFEFGTNWARYSKFVGDVFGSALAAEGIFAFALESGFLGILIFGWNKVKPWVHMVATTGVFLGALFSAIWIVVALSWQQTPAGFHIVGEGADARAEITDFWAMVFNPSSVIRVTHVWIGALLSGAFLVLSVHAYYIMKGRHVKISKMAFKVALVTATVLSLGQLLAGHQSAVGVYETQPAKMAAFEGHFEESAPADMYLLGVVNKQKQEVKGIKIPGGLSFLLTFDFKAPVAGLNSIPENDRPKQVNAVFQFYHLMVIFGFTMIILTLFASFLWWRGKLFDKKWLMVVFVFAVLLPQLSNQLGWFAAEMGRQPWVVYGILRTSDAFSLSVTEQQLVFSIVLFSIVYVLLFTLFIYLLNKKIQNGPSGEGDVEDRPLQAEMTEVITGGE